MRRLWTVAIFCLAAATSFAASEFPLTDAQREQLRQALPGVDLSDSQIDALRDIFYSHDQPVRVRMRAMSSMLGLDQMPQVIQPVPGAEVTGPAPLSLNVGDGTRTAAFFQFDRITRDGVVQSASHTATPKSDEGRLQWSTVLSTWVRGGPVEIVDPYAALGTPAVE